MSYERTQKSILTSRLREPRKFIQVVYGPRQVGKTTMITQLVNQSDLPVHFAAADAVAKTDNIWVAQQWEIARLRTKQAQAPYGLLIIDEIQKVTNWSEAVKQQWDQDTRHQVPLKVVLLGSSRLLLQQGLTESLAGRFETLYMGHWTFTEMRDAFDVEALPFVWYGGYPGAVPLFNDESRWKQYVRDSLIETSISKDILMLTRVDKPALMKRMFELGCLFSGQILSYSKIVGQLQDAGNTTTLSHYLRLLDTAGLLAGIEKYNPEVLRQRASSPKFQVHNTALLSAQSPETFQSLMAAPEKWGRWVESAIGAHLLNAALSENFQLFYWRHRNEEVDFVIEKDGKTVGIEVKSGTARSTSGMTAFKNKFNPQKMYLVGTGGLPWQEFLTINPIDLF